jgi:hypothetical protein
VTLAQRRVPFSFDSRLFCSLRSQSIRSSLGRPTLSQEREFPRTDRDTSNAAY